MDTLGTSIGRDYDAIRNWLQDKIRSYRPFIDNLQSPLLPPQHTYLVLKASGHTKANYLSRVAQPVLAREAFEELDEMLMEVVQNKILTKAKHPGLDTPHNADWKTQAKLPVRHGGLGLTSTWPTSAFQHSSGMCLAAAAAAEKNASGELSLLDVRPRPP